jgi:hypothetical protein
MRRFAELSGFEGDDADWQEEYQMSLSMSQMSRPNCQIRFILVAKCGKGRVTQQSTWTHLDLDLCKSFNVESKGRGWECDTSRQIKQLD